MTLTDELLSDLISQTASLPQVLRKARILAYQMKLEPFQEWLDNELNGYQIGNPDLPDYRVIPCSSTMDLENMVRRGEGVAVPVGMIPQEYHHHVSHLRIANSVAALEQMLEETKGTDKRIGIRWPEELIALVNHKMRYGYVVTDISMNLGRSDIAGVLDSVRNRLQKFILEVVEQYPEATQVRGPSQPKPNTLGALQNLFNITIMGDYSGAGTIIGVAGGNMEANAVKSNSGDNVNINVEHSVVGAISTGAQSNINAIDINASILSKESGAQEISEALTKLKDAIVENHDLASHSKEEALDNLAELSRQATLNPEQRSRPGVIRSLITGLTSAITSVGKLSEAWDTYGDKILDFFSLGSP